MPLGHSSDVLHEYYSLKILSRVASGIAFAPFLFDLKWYYLYREPDTRAKDPRAKDTRAKDARAKDLRAEIPIGWTLGRYPVLL